VNPPRRLHRSHDHKIAGVCGGIAEYFAVDPTLVRVIFAALIVLSAGAGGLILYGILWLVMPGPEGEPPPVQTGAGANNGPLLIGACLVIFGVLLMLERIPMLWAFGIGLVRFSVPLLLIAVGVLLLISRGRR
jgi:phage shock protein C